MSDVVGTIASVRSQIVQAKRRGQTVGFVPTMGALHAGHERLLDVCRAECDFSVASIFVNPFQFERTDDLQKYPRPMERDLQICAGHGVDLVFAPGTSEVYPDQQLTVVRVGELSDGLCGKSRHGHFHAVATVVAKLFNIVQPDRAYFGGKDAQQLAVIRRMVADLDFPITIIGVPTVREHDGLALSSRNSHLSADQRAAAPVLYRALQTAQEALRSGERDAEKVKAHARAVLAAEQLARPEYFEVVDAARLTPVTTVEQPVLIATAVWFGDTRLIDNVSWTPERNQSA